MKIRFLSLLLAFALLINFSGVHALAMELSIALAETALMPSQGESIRSAAHSGCAMHAHKHATTANQTCYKVAKKTTFAAR